MMNHSLTGVIPPVSTILDQDNQLDLQATGRLIDFLIKSGVDGLLFLGSGGEFTQLSKEERKCVASFAIGHVNGRVPVIIGTGSTNEREAIELTKHSEEMGADAVMVINPYYWPLTEDNILLYYNNIAKSTRLPILIYNFPKLTGQDLSADLVLKMVESNERIIGIKDTVESLSHIREMTTTVKAKYPNFSIFTGFEDHFLNTLLLGGDGIISASGNFLPELAIRLFQGYKQNDYEKVIESNRKLIAVPEIFKLDSPFINVIKTAIRMRGINVGENVLPPLTNLSESQEEKLRETLTFFMDDDGHQGKGGMLNDY